MKLACRLFSRDEPRARRASWAASVSLLLLASLAVPTGPPARAQSDPAALQVKEELQAKFRRREELRERVEQLERAFAAWQGARQERYSAGEVGDLRVAPTTPNDLAVPDWMFGELTSRSDRKSALRRRELDLDADGRPELIQFIDPATQHVVRAEADENCDGATDSWSRYAGGVLVARELDQSGDGKPDAWEEYAKGRMTSLEIDRDDDGTRDAFFRYRGQYIAEEAHDADNDGSIELRVVFDNRVRVRSEEDSDRDGRMDTRTLYHVVEGAELISRIEREARGDGTPRTVETYEAVAGRAVLARKEEDLNGDGTADVVSYYENGSLVRREISSERE